MVIKIELCSDLFQERFWSKVEKTEECWNWIGAIQSKGYGSISINGRTYSAHRVSYAMKYGKVPYGMFILHRCDNRKCVNPDHLFLGTAKDNSVDMVNKQRMSPRSGFRKISKNEVEQIRLNYISGRGSYRLLAKQYQLSPRTIGAIINRESWK